MSSAYIAVCVFFNFGMSLMYMMKRRGLSMEPCETSAGMLLVMNDVPLVIT